MVSGHLLSPGSGRWYKTSASSPSQLRFDTLEIDPLPPSHRPTSPRKRFRDGSAPPLPHRIAQGFQRCHLAVRPRMTCRPAGHPRQRSTRPDLTRQKARWKRWKIRLSNDPHGFEAYYIIRWFSWSNEASQRKACWITSFNSTPRRSMGLPVRTAFKTARGGGGIYGSMGRQSYGIHQHPTLQVSEIVAFGY